MQSSRFIRFCLVFLSLLLAACSSGDTPAPLTSEAGYIEIEPISFSLQQQGRDTYSDTSSTARILYSFHPAKQVVLVGESYSGTRVSTMLNLLLFYSNYGTG